METFSALIAAQHLREFSSRGESCSSTAQHHVPGPFQSILGPGGLAARASFAASEEPCNAYSVRESAPTTMARTAGRKKEGRPILTAWLPSPSLVSEFQPHRRPRVPSSVGQ
ncbi:hypothetical protein HYQ44_013692 [Verticillium longisporum]|nr:hypothetical protein HYQ44_013692 [Verticillium longisporum]